MAIKISVDTNELKTSSCVDLIRCIQDIDMDVVHRSAYSTGILRTIRRPIEAEVCKRLSVDKINQCPGNLNKEYAGKAVWDMAESWDKENPDLPVHDVETQPDTPAPTPDKLKRNPVRKPTKLKVSQQDLASITDLL